jgi:hypothetical protein
MPIETPIKALIQFDGSLSLSKENVLHYSLMS